MPQQGLFNPVSLDLTISGSHTVPAGFKKLRVYVESGSATIDGVSFNAITNRVIEYGGYDSWTSFRPIAISCPTAGTHLSHVIYEL